MLFYITYFVSTSVLVYVTASVENSSVLIPATNAFNQDNITVMSTSINSKEQFVTSPPPRLVTESTLSAAQSEDNAMENRAADGELLRTKEELTGYYAWYGIMVVRRSAVDGSITKGKVCTSFYPEITDMAQNETAAEFYPVQDALEWWSPCSTPPPIDPVSGQLLLLDGREDAVVSNCTLLSTAAAVQGYGWAGAVFVRDQRPPRQTSNATLWLTFVSNNTYEAALSGAPDLLEVAVYSPREEFAFNYSLVIIWLLAVCTVTVGAYWSGLVRHRLYQESLQTSQPLPEENGVPPSGEQGGEESDEEGEPRLRAAGERRGSNTPVYPKEETSLDITPKVTLFFVLLMCVMLVSLYFLYQYLVYMIIALFCTASIGAVYSCLEPLVSRVPCGTCRTPYFNLGVVRGQLELRHALLLAASLALTITWLVLRNEPYAWILQDILGVAFCINMLRLIRLPNLKICTVLLSCLFFYDIFFVFITPLFTADGTSIMVEVAQGSSAGGEQLPMVFRVPHFTYSEVVAVCELPGNYNLLGFGDVLVPGLLLAYLHSYDLLSGRRKCPLYFIVNVIAYGVGLCLTFVGLYLMRGAQPALLYLVPCTLLPTVVIAAIKGDLANMWRGGPTEVEGNRGDSSKDDDGAVTEVVAQ